MHNADLYQQSNNLQKRDVLEILEKYTPQMRWKQKINRVIDMGCGDGSVTNILRKYIPTDYTLVGSDINEDMVKHANDNYGDKHTTFIVLDIAGDFPEVMKENFDHVFSFYALNWIIDQKKAFRNVFNLLDQDGDCFMIIVAYCSIYDVYRIMSQYVKWSAWVHDVDKYISPYHDSKEPDKEVKKLTESIGFVDIDVECKDKASNDNADVLSKLIMAVSPFQIPKEKWDDFLKDYIQVLKDIGPDDNNSPEDVKVYYKLVLARGRKP